MWNQGVNKVLSNQPLLNLDYQMCFALYSSSLAMTKIYKPLLAQFGLTYPQYLVLLVLWEKDQITVNTLGERLFLDSGTLTPLLKRLEKLALITRKREAIDGRKVIITLTQLGHSLREGAAKLPAIVSCNTGCTPPEIQKLNQELIKLRAHLNANLNVVKTFSKAI